MEKKNNKNISSTNSFIQSSEIWSINYTKDSSNIFSQYEFKQLSVHTTSEKFEKAALSFRLGLPSTLIRHENENSLQTGGIWKSRLCNII